jgi:Phosphorylase superfamily
MEYDAVALLFDEYWDHEGDSYGRAPGDENTYLTGRINKHAVVLVLLPGVGKVNVARAGANFSSSYGGIRLALLVGICGGVPKDNEGKDILLGDVVISTQVIEYGLVRRFPDRSRRKCDPGDSHGRANTGIRGFVGTLQTKFQSQRLEARTAHYLAVLQRRVQTTEYEYPGASNDRLFQSTYRHKHHHEGRCGICSRCRKKAHPVCEQALSSSCNTLADPEAADKQTG